MTSLFPRSNRWVFNASNGGEPWNPSLTLKVNSLKFGLKSKLKLLNCQSVVKQTHFQNLKEKKKVIFLIIIELKETEQS